MSEQNVIIHRCAWDDLALMTTVPKTVGPNVEFVDITSNWIDPPERELVHCFGFPSDKSVPWDTRIIEGTEERTFACYPDIFHGAVLPLPSEEDLKFKITAFNRERHFLIPFEAAATGRHPRGFSGAAAWWESNEPKLVWRANFKFAGICTSCYKGGSVEQVVKASAVRRFVQEVFAAET